MVEYIPLAFGLEALYPPVQLNAQQLREIYVRLADPCRFTEFKQVGESHGARLAEGKNRYLTIAGDRFVYRDDYTHALFTTFNEDVNQILTVLRETLRIPVLLHCKVLVRLLMPYHGPDNTIVYFQQKFLSNVTSHMGRFERSVSGIGAHFVFPPTQEHHSSFHLRLEPYFPDLKMFFMENTAQFFDPLVNIKDITGYLTTAYDFLRDKAGPFILSLGEDNNRN